MAYGKVTVEIEAFVFNGVMFLEKVHIFHHYKKRELTKYTVKCYFSANPF